MLALVMLTAHALAADPTHAQLEAASWDQLTTKKHADAGEVGIFHTTIAGIDCFRGTAVTDVSGDVMLEVVKDIEGAMQWSSAGVTEAKLLRDGARQEYYQYLDVPGWTMASDRFWFLYSTVERTGAKISFRWYRLLDGGDHAEVYASVKAEHPNAIEPPINVGGWYFETAADGVQIEYAVCTQPGGAIPVPVQNAATRKTLPDTVGDLVREARRRAK